MQDERYQEAYVGLLEGFWIASAYFANDPKELGRLTDLIEEALCSHDVSRMEVAFAEVRRLLGDEP
jgi:hypothetical protein